MGIGLSGMVSGLDTDAIVKAMVSGQQAKATKVENKITLNKWTKEAWSGLNTKIYSFYTKYASKLRLQISYMTRTASSSNESIVKATAGSGAAVGTHSLQVKSLASSQYVTGAQLKDKTNSSVKANYNKNTKLAGEKGLGIDAGTIITIKGQVGTEDEEVVKLEVTDKTTIDDFLSACKEAGLTASFDTNQQRFFISSSESGMDDKFSITSNNYVIGTGENASNVLEEISKTIEDMVDSSYLSSSSKASYDEAVAIIRQNVNLITTVLSEKYDSSDKTQKEVMTAIDTIKKLSEETYADQTANDKELEKIDNLINDTSAVLTDVLDGNSQYSYTSREELKNQAKDNVNTKLRNTAEAVARKELATWNITMPEGNYIDPEDITIDKWQDAKELIADKNISELDIDSSALSDSEKQQLKDAYAIVNTWNYETAEGKKVGSAYWGAYLDEKGTDAEYNALVKKEMKALLIADKAYKENIDEYKKDILADSNYKNVISERKEKIEEGLVSVAEQIDNVDTTSNSLSKIGLGEIDGTVQYGTEDGKENGTPANKMVVVAASDAEFVLDGATMTETSNSFTVNGLTLNLSGTTKNEETGKYDTVQITVGKDVDSTYKLVKEAITEYNKLLEEMNTLYNADSARGYDPLTDEQKESMSETDIENWEKKIKDSLLRRDDTLGTLLTSMRNALSTSYTDEDGKTYSLASYGIVTGHYTEKGKLHIYGDEEDATYATYTDRLKAALEEDPDKVMETLTHIFGNLYSTMTEKCAKTEISSALTFYNDKQYNNLLKDYEDDLDILEDRIKELEDRYYKQFTAMEKAMSVLQNQSNSLASLLGTGGQ